MRQMWLQAGPRYRLCGLDTAVNLPLAAVESARVLTAAVGEGEFCTRIECAPSCDRSYKCRHGTGSPWWCGSLHSGSMQHTLSFHWV